MIILDNLVYSQQKFEMIIFIFTPNLPHRIVIFYRVRVIQEGGKDNIFTNPYIKEKMFTFDLSLSKMHKRTSIFLFICWLK